MRYLIVLALVVLVVCLVRVCRRERRRSGLAEGARLTLGEPDDEP